MELIIVPNNTVLSVSVCNGQWTITKRDAEAKSSFYMDENGSEAFLVQESTTAPTARTRTNVCYSSWTYLDSVLCLSSEQFRRSATFPARVAIEVVDLEMQ